MSEQNSSSGAERVVCPAAKDPTIRLLIIAMMLAGYGLWCVYDIWVAKVHTPADGANYWFNVVCAIGLTPVGLALLALAVLRTRMKFVADGEGLGYAGKQKVAWDDITELDPRGKGRLDVYYKADGEEGLFKLDSWKISNFDALVKLIEAKAPEVPTGSP